MEEVHQPGDLEDPHGTPLDAVNGKAPPLFAQALLRVDQGGDARAVDEGESGEVEYEHRGPVLNKGCEHSGQFRRGGHVQFSGQEDNRVVIESENLGREALCRDAHAGQERHRVRRG